MLLTCEEAFSSPEDRQWAWPSWEIWDEEWRGNGGGEERGEGEREGGWKGEGKRRD